MRHTSLVDCIVVADSVEDFNGLIFLPVHVRRATEMAFFRLEQFRCSKTTSGTRPATAEETARRARRGTGVPAIRQTTLAIFGRGVQSKLDVPHHFADTVNSLGDGGVELLNVIFRANIVDVGAELQLAPHVVFRQDGKPKVGKKDEGEDDFHDLDGL